MWTAFDPEVFSVIFALNHDNPFVEASLVAGLIPEDKAGIFKAAKLHGVFEGKSEYSYQIDKRALDWDKFLDLMRKYDQKVVLVVRDFYVYALYQDKNYYQDNFTPPVGYLVEIPKEETFDEDYTYCPESDKYFVIEV